MTADWPSFFLLRGLAALGIGLALGAAAVVLEGPIYILAAAAALYGYGTALSWVAAMLKKQELDQRYAIREKLKSRGPIRMKGD